MPGGAWAQQPEIAGVFPAGGQRGTTVAVQVDGHNLQDAKVLLSGRGVAVAGVKADAKGEQATVTLAIASDAPLGPRELRIGSAHGVSNPARLWVDVFPGTREVEPNEDDAHAQALEHTPVVINGRMQAPTDRDTFAFQARKGETWVFDCNAARIRSHLDPVLELRDEHEKPLRMAQSVWESDPRLVYRFEKDGRYFLTVRDTQFLGGADYPYRLTVGPLAAIEGFLPRGGRPGQAVMLTVAGIHLGDTCHITVPIPANAVEGEVWVSPETANGPTLPIPLLVNSTLLVLTAPNTTPITSFPVAVDGEFARGATDRFPFAAKAKERFTLDLLGRRIGSRIDGLIRVLDGAGKELAANDDAIGKDARLDFEAPADGVYTVEIANVEGKSGPDCFYRLLMTRAVPDFRLTLNADRLHVGVSGTMAFMVEAERLNGFDAPISFQIEGLPPGVTCSGGVLTADTGGIELTLSAAPNTKLDASEIHVRGTANWKGKALTREAGAREQYLPRAIDPGMFTDDSYRRPYRACDLLPLGVIARAEPFALSTDLKEVVLAPGKSVEIVVRAERNTDAKGEIALEVRHLSAKVTVKAPAIPADRSETRVTLTAAADAPVALRNLIIQGRLKDAVQVAPAIHLAVRIPPR